MTSRITERSGDKVDRIFSASDAESALDFAQRELKRGTYQFFRGQENADWIPEPSWFRIPMQNHGSVKERISLFLSYTREVARNAGIEYSDDALVAIAQHYGIPTTFLDLTTDPIVAALFACPANTTQGSAKAAILLYSDEKIRQWQDLAKTLADTGTLELIRIDVSNLWRLQAQRGLFLYFGLTTFCDYVLPDRVEFPHPAGGLSNSEYVLYPVEKSPLETQLDLFFNLEATENAKKRFREEIPVHFITPAFSTATVANTTMRLASALKNVSEEWVSREKALHQMLRSNAAAIGNWPLRTLPDTYYEPTWRFKSGELWPHPSWFAESADAWLKTPVEQFSSLHSSQDNRIEIDLSVYGDAAPCGDRAPAGTEYPITGARRTKSASFGVLYEPWRKSDPKHTPGAATEIEQRFGVIAQNLWDGMRSKPLSDALLARCMDRFFLHAKVFLDCQIRGTPVEWDACYGRRDVEHIKVEYAALGGHSQGLQVLCSDLLRAVRPDFDEVVEVLQSDKRRHFPHLTQMIYPQYLFEFDRFVELYCVSMLPYQAFIGAITWSEHLGLAFNPRQLKIFGRA